MAAGLVGVAWPILPMAAGQVGRATETGRKEEGAARAAQQLFSTQYDVRRRATKKDDKEGRRDGPRMDPIQHLRGQ